MQLLLKITDLPALAEGNPKFSILGCSMLLKEPWYSGVARMVTIRIPRASLMVAPLVRVVESGQQDTRFAQPLVRGGTIRLEREGS